MYDAALVLEGGAMRGQYTAGVLDAFLAAKVHFSLVVGVSAGALCATNYLAEQAGRTNRINTKYRTDKDYISVQRALRRQDIINLDYLFASHGGDWEDFDARTYRTSASEFVVVATALATGRSVYFRHPQGKTLVADLKASAALPFMSRPVATEQGLCLDGGVANSIPFAYAQQRGFTKVVVVRTRERTFRKTPTSKVLQRAYRHAYAGYPAFAETGIKRPEMYNTQASALQQLEQAGQAFVLAPAQPVTVSRLERDVDKLQALYQQGSADGQANLAKLQAYLKN